DRRQDRHRRTRPPRPHPCLRPLPRPQIRRDPPGRLLLALRRLRQQRGPAGAAADRSTRPDARLRRLREAVCAEEEAARGDARPAVRAAERDGPAARGRLPGPGSHHPARSSGDGDLLPLPRPRGPAPAPERMHILAPVTSRESTCYFPKANPYTYMSRSEQDMYGAMLNGLDVLAVQRPGAPPRAMVMVDTPELYDPHVFVRGNAGVP